MKEKSKVDLIEYRINKSKETLSEVSSLIKLGFYNNAVNRLYYACFYAVNALMLKKNIKAKTHDGIRQMFGLHYVKTGIISKEMGRLFTILYEKRHSGDYEDFISYNKETVEELLNPSKEFILTVEKILND